MLAAAPAAFADQVRSHEWWLTNLHVPTAWQSSRGGGVTVAVLDTGVDAQQPDLAGAVINGPDFTKSGRKPGGPQWGVHGTVVASLIAGRGHGPGNGNGVIGVAPAAQILSVRVTLEQTDPLLAKPAIAQGLPGAIAHGIRYAVNHGATVIDLPLDPVTAARAPGAGGSTAEQAAVSYALHHNVVLVAPAGDGGAGTDPVNYPAAYPGVVAVGAFDPAYTKPAFTTHHSYVTVTAPGVSMIAATPAGYATVSTTAASSAVVTGIVTLIRAQDPALSPAQITKVLEKSTVYRPAAGRVPGSGFGTVDAGLAILNAARMDKHAPAPTQAPSPAASAPSKAPAAAVSAAPTAQATSGGSLLLVGLIGAVVGVILLIVVVLLLMQIRRRRARAARLAPIRVAAQMQPRRAALPGAEGPPPGGADAVAERIAASTSVAFTPRPDPPITSGAPPWEATPWPSAGGTADLAASGTPGSAVVPWSAAAAGAPAAGNAGAAGSGALVPANPGGSRLPQRAPAVRTPMIVGTPPWEPAPKPESELPWTANPPRRTGGGGGGGGGAIAPPLPHRRPQPPQASPWDAMAEEAWPGGGPAAGRPQLARPGGPGSEPPGSAGEAGPAGAGGGTPPGGFGVGGSGTGGTPAGGFGVGGSGTGAAGADGAGGSSAGSAPDDSDSAGLWAAGSGSAASGSGAGTAGGAAAAPWPAAAPWSPAGGVSGAGDEPGGSGLFVDFGPPPAAANGNGDAAAGNGMLSAGLPDSGYSSPAGYSTGSYSATDYSTGSHSATDYSTGSFSTGGYSTGGQGTGGHSSSGYSTGSYSTAGSYGATGGGERDDNPTETGSRPLYGWSPGDATESFPSYRPDDD